MYSDQDKKIQEEINLQLKKASNEDIIQLEVDSSENNQENLQNIEYQIEKQNNQNPDRNQLQQEKQQDKIEQPEQYEAYGQYDEYDGYMSDQSMNPNVRRASSQRNAQYQMQDLVKIIDKEVQKVMQLTGFSKEWALIYFQTCGWKSDLVERYIDAKRSNVAMINYKPTQSSISNISGTCDVCCQQNKIICQNICGDQFCEECWKGQLTERLRSFNRDPFPPCINESCPIRISPFISEEISKNDLNFKKLYHRTLCRSYAYGSTSVKICKGRQKFSCDKCFKITKIFQLIECQNCGNMVCGRCGEQYHLPSQCFDGPNLKKIVEESTNFVQNLNYRICPYCKQAVERSSGCNSLICKCKQTFCYICGQKWLPNHSQHGVCYREKQIKTLEQEKKKKADNQKEYLDKLEKYKADIQSFIGKSKSIQQIDIQQIKSSLIKNFEIISNQLDYLQPLKHKLKIALLIGKNYTLTTYFKEDDQIMKAQIINLKNPIQKAYDFFILTIPAILEAFGSQNQEKKNFSKLAFDLRKNKGFNPNEQLAKLKMQMLECMKIFEKHTFN